MEVNVSIVDTDGRPEYRFEVDKMHFFGFDVHVGRLTRSLRMAGISEDDVQEYISEIHSQAMELGPLEPEPVQSPAPRASRSTRSKPKPQPEPEPEPDGDPEQPEPVEGDEESGDGEPADAA